MRDRFLADLTTVPPAFLTQTGRVGQQIAVELLGYNVGEQLPTVEQFADRYEVGTGTVQKALAVLRDTGGVKLRARGHRGTIVEAVDPVALWVAAGRTALVGSMALPYSRRYEGLATGLLAGWSDDLELLISFARGSQQRLNALRARRVDFTVISRHAANEALRESDDLVVLHELPEHSYASGHEVLFAQGVEPTISDGYRLGIDPLSTDQVALTKLEAEGRDVSLVEVGYLQMISAMQDQQIDCAVFNADETSISMAGIQRLPLATPAARQMHADVTTAVIVTLAAATANHHLVSHLLDTDTLWEVQQRVVAGEQLPSY